MQKETLLRKANEFRDSELHATFRALLLTEINILRERNDVAEKDDVLRNQGAIHSMKKLLKALSYNEDEKPTEYDGGYT